MKPNASCCSPLPDRLFYCAENRIKYAKEVAPEQEFIGVMLPYTPLHYLLLEKADGFPQALVMTSGNVSEEPIATDNDEARERLTSLAMRS